jgi:hypothetical protein
MGTEAAGCWLATQTALPFTSLVKTDSASRSHLSAQMLDDAFQNAVGDHVVQAEAVVA